jgi:hypothetical protein
LWLRSSGWRSSGWRTSSWRSSGRLTGAPLLAPLVALFDSGLAFAIHHCLTDAAACRDLGDQAVRLKKRRGGHSLRRRCDD